MFLIVTRSFPPEVGGMQNLMWGLTYSLSKYDLVKVFADYNDNYKEHDKNIYVVRNEFFGRLTKIRGGREIGLNKPGNFIPFWRG